MAGRAWFLACLLTLASLAGGTAQASVVIEAKVDGVNKSIGTLEAAISVKDIGRIVGTFKFDPAFAYLDGWYDFRWVNIQTAYILGGVAQANDPITGKLPGVDPQPKPTAPGEADQPFYYNDGEWLPPGKTLTYGTGAKQEKFVIHNEGKESLFVDRPSDGANNSVIKFTTYLVVKNVTDPGFPVNQFGVLGAFHWEYDNKGNAANGESTLTLTQGTPALVAGDVTLINNAIGNAGADGFGTWKAVGAFDVNLRECPEPASWALLACGGMLLLATRTRRAA